MRRAWVLPAVILVVLILAGAFRYSEIASKTTDYHAYKWVLDRWTGEVWARDFSADSTGQFVETLSAGDAATITRAVERRNSMTLAWEVCLTAAITWLICVIWILPWYNKKKPKGAKPHPRLKRWSDL